jgi:tetratricopeptide (TPR) repeat protein
VDSLSQLAAAARRDGVRWIYFSWPEAEMRPQFKYLLDTTSAVPGLTVRVVTTNHPAVLYEIGPDFGRDPAWLSDPWQVALHRARAMVSIDQRDWRACMVVANEEQRLGHWEAAQPLLDAALRGAPNDPDVALALADNLVHMGRYAVASELYARVEHDQPGNPRTRIGAGWAELLAGHTQEAARIWRPMVTLVDDQGTLDRMLALYTSVNDAAAVAEVRGRMRALGMHAGIGGIQ